MTTTRFLSRRSYTQHAPLASAAAPRFRGALARALAGATLALSAVGLASWANVACAADLPVLKVGDQSLQTRGILEASGQLKDLPYRIEWFNFPAAQPLGEALNAGA